MISGVRPVTLRSFSAVVFLFVLASLVVTLACRGPEQTAPASPAPVPQPTIQPAHSPAALQTPTPAAATSYTPTPGTGPVTDPYGRRTAHADAIWPPAHSTPLHLRSTAASDSRVSVRRPTLKSGYSSQT